MVSIEKIKKLRQETSISLSECKKALEQTQGDLEKAKEVLRKKGMEFALKRGERGTGEGIIASYIHTNKKIGAMLELRCETDFVARSQEFQNLAHDLTLHIVAAAPRFIRSEEIPDSCLEKEKEIYQGQFSKIEKPKEIIDKIIEGKLVKFKKEISLLEQGFVREPEKTVKQFVDEHIAKLGENVVIEGFVRYEI